MCFYGPYNEGNGMTKENLFIQKCMAVFLTLTGMACGMDQPSKGVDAIPELMDDQNSQFSRIPHDLLPGIGYYKDKGFKMTCPTIAELEKAAAKNPNKLEFEYKVEKTSLVFHVWANVKGPYKFNRVYISQGAKNPSIQCLYTNREGKGNVDVRLDTNALRAQSVISCQGDPNFRVESYPSENYMGYGKTDNPEDIVITCKTN